MSLIAENISLGQNGGALRLHNVSCKINPGCLTVVIGPNGSGKSSLIKVLAGSIAPDAGKVLLNGRGLAEWSPLQLARLRAVLAQQALLDFPFQVKEVVALGRSPYRSAAEKDARLVDESLRLFDLLEFSNRLYTTLSGGEQQRVQLARVWVQLSGGDSSEPHYLLLDEPTSALDLRHQRQLMELLRQSVRDKRMAVVLVLHDLNMAALYADRLLLLKQGKVIASGKPEQVLRREFLESAYQLEVDLLPYRASGRQVVLIPG